MDKAQNKEKRSVSVKTIGFTLGGLGIVIVGLLVASLYMLSFEFKNVKKTTEEYVSLKT